MEGFDFSGLKKKEVANPPTYSVGTTFAQAKLKAAQRKRLKKSTFGLPSQRKYPMPDRSHAANAKARAKQQLKAGRISRSTYNKIVAKANKVLGKKKK